MSAQQRTGQRKFNNSNHFRFNNQNRQNFVKKRFNNQQGVSNGQNQIPKQNRDAIIARNLQHMKQVAQKKRAAQEFYYGAGRSPMIKTPSGTFIKQESRVSVQQRLGNANRPKFVNSNTNTNKKPVFINRKNGPAISNMRSDKIMRVQNFQNKRRNNINSNGMIKTIGSNGKVLYLYPTKSVPVRNMPMRKTIRKPTNLSVRVENDGKHHVKHDLNPVLQQEIKLIQSKSIRQVVEPQVYPPMEIMYGNSSNVDRLPITATRKTLHERFSSI